ncbi:MAG: hypothetical protein EZS28_004968 [Streblomastix strix]|uniref:Uncharacterized protein n=1 Tax=Streblomastix strix TaxID=222440 RepID=A0A5J4WXF0_9EUKA|nr:MAG: hypothetical protein EZS28_004968 [Streblomastix strix]
MFFLVVLSFLASSLIYIILTYGFIQMPKQIAISVTYIAVLLTQAISMIYILGAEKGLFGSLISKHRITHFLYLVVYLFSIIATSLYSFTDFDKVSSDLRLRWSSAFFIMHIFIYFPAFTISSILTRYVTQFLCDVKGDGIIGEIISDILAAIDCTIFFIIRQPDLSLAQKITAQSGNLSVVQLDLCFALISSLPFVIVQCIVRTRLTIKKEKDYMKKKLQQTTEIQEEGRLLENEDRKVNLGLDLNDNVDDNEIINHSSLPASQTDEHPIQMAVQVWKERKQREYEQQLKKQCTHDQQKINKLQMKKQKLEMKQKQEFEQKVKQSMKDVCDLNTNTTDNFSGERYQFAVDFS